MSTAITLRAGLAAGTTGSGILILRMIILRITLLADCRYDSKKMIKGQMLTQNINLQVKLQLDRPFATGSRCCGRCGKF
jgi:hypothetical protein